MTFGELTVEALGINMTLVGMVITGFGVAWVASLFGDAMRIAERWIGGDSDV